MKPPVHPIESIHHINGDFNRFFSMPLYFAGMLVTAVLLVSPYGIRMFLAFFVNALFNRPAVYLAYFSKYVGKRMNFLLVSAAYLLAFGTYAFFFRLARFFGSAKTESNWKRTEASPDGESYYYQS